MTIGEVIDVGITTAGSTRSMALRACENSNNDESRDEQDIEDDEYDSKHVATTSFDTESECHGNQGVEDCGCEDAFDGTIGS